MEKSIFGNKISLGGLAGLTKKVAAPAKETPAAKAAPSAFKADSLVRTGAVATPASPVNAGAAAELRLAKAYHADPATFARNMARHALEDMVAHLG